MRNLLVSVLMFFCITSYADELLPIPSLNGSYIVDMSGVLTKNDITVMNQKLSSMDKEKGNVTMGVLIIPTTNGEPLEQFSMRTAEKWQLGHSDRENGVVFVVAINDKKSRLEVGRGISGDLSDIVAKGMLLKNAAYFKKGDYRSGILSVISDVDEVVKAPAAPVSSQVSPVDYSYAWLPVIAVLGIFVFLFYVWWDKKEEERKKEELRQKNMRSAEEMLERSRKATEARNTIKTSTIGPEAGPARVSFPYKVEQSVGLASTSAALSAANIVKQEEKARAIRRMEERRRWEKEEEEARRRRNSSSQESNISDDILSAGIGLAAGLALGGRDNEDDNQTPSFSPSIDTSDNSSTSYDGGGASSSWGDSGSSDSGSSDSGSSDSGSSSSD